jgi:hypothetical protein
MALSLVKAVLLDLAFHLKRSAEDRKNLIHGRGHRTRHGDDVEVPDLRSGDTRRFPVFMLTLTLAIMTVIMLLIIPTLVGFATVAGERRSSWGVRGPARPLPVP